MVVGGSIEVVVGGSIEVVGGSEDVGAIVVDAQFAEVWSNPYTGTDAHMVLISADKWSMLWCPTSCMSLLQSKAAEIFFCKKWYNHKLSSYKSHLWRKVHLQHSKLIKRLMKFLPRKSLKFNHIFCRLVSFNTIFSVQLENVCWWIGCRIYAYV